MKNSKLRRILLTLACAVLLVSLSVGATLAYLTSVTGVVTNTFTYGNVEITLDEGDVWESTETGFTAENNGKFKEDAERVTENKYKLIPGRTYDKDPTVHVADTSEDAYIFVEVVNGFEAYEAESNTIAAQMTAKNWVEVDENIFCLTDGNGKALVCEAGADPVVFEEFTMSGNLTNEQFDAAKNATITITAYAIQAEGISADNPANIWTMYLNQVAANNAE